MGILLDIVPNHMGIGPHNPYWEEVLAHGLHSRYARWFDVDWAAGGNKIVLPVLGDELDAVLARGEITLDVKEKTPRLCYHESSWPVDPATLPEELQLARFDPTAVTDTALFRYPHYHLSTDTWDKLDYQRFALVVSGMEKVIIDLADVPR